MADIQELITDLEIRDNLSLGLAKAKDSVGNFGDTVALQSLRANNALGNLGDNVRAKFSGIGEDIKRGIGLGLGIGTVQLIAGATNAIQDFFSQSVQGAVEEEAGIARLSQTLKANVRDWDGNTQGIERNISARVALGFTDDQLRDSFNTIVAATGDINKALEVQSVAMDLARFKRISLAEASDALTKVEAGSFRILKSLGIELAANATQVEALAAVEKLAGGQAETFGETTAGAMDKVGAKVDQLRDKIGTGLVIPIKLVTAGAGEVADFFSGALSEKIDAQGDQIAKQAADFVRTATREQVQAARDGVAEELAHAQSLFGPHGAEKDIEAVLATLDARLAKTAEGFEETNRASLKWQGAVADLQPEVQTVADLIRTLNSRTEDNAGLTLKAAGATDVLTQAEKDLADQRQRLAGGGIGNTINIGGENVPTGQGKSLGEAFLDSLTQKQQEADRQAQLAADRQRKADQDRAERIAKAKADAAAYADVLRNRVDAAFDRSKTTADRLFDALHERHLQAIKDAETLAEKQHDAATQAINDALKLRLEQNAAPVNEAEKRQQAIETARQRRDLTAGLQTALAGGDPLAIRSAQEALQSFNAQQRIASLREQQAKLDIAAQAEATAAQKAADDKLTAAKLAQAKAIEEENTRAKKQREDFDRALAALKVRDATNPAKFAKDAAELSAKFGITTDAAGFHHIGDVLATAIKNVKIPAPNVTLSATFYSPPIYLNARLIAAAMASGQSQTATPGVRTGTLKPKAGG